MVECSDNEKLRQFVFKNEKPPIVVTQIQEDPLHQCIYLCPDCKTCFHNFICSCEEHRVRRNYCHHLCAVGMDKKLRFQFYETNDNSFSSPDFNDDFGCQDGYETDEADETQQIEQAQQRKKLLTESQPTAQVSTKELGVDDINKAAQDYHVLAIHAVSDQPHRIKEFHDLMMEAINKFKLHTNSNIDQISAFEVEKTRKRIIESQTRLSQKKSKRN